MRSLDYEDKVVFAVGTGRCGTKFLRQVLAREPEVAASHERNRMNEAFQRYCRWHRLPVDDEGFLYTKEVEIEQDLAEHKLSFEASAYLSLSIEKLHERFGARFILLVRRPDRVVNSFWRKGLYQRKYVQADVEKALGYQHHERDHHFFARIAPFGTEFDQWNRMSRVGKLGWFWNAINLAVIEQFSVIPRTHWRIVKLEQLSHAAYLKLAEFMGIAPNLTEADYLRIAERPPGWRPRVYTTADWSAREIAEFEAQVQRAAEYFDYEYRVSDLLPAAYTPSQDERFDIGRLLHRAGRDSRRMIARILQRPSSRHSHGKD